MAQAIGNNNIKFVLVDRPEIHKSCRSLETLLNVFNDYCEAAGAVVVLQKKLAKALRETAGLKVTSEVAGNAMNASATIFEALSDVDAKFAKIADREYDAISGEVKKWFKKLAKDEKIHDERLANANARIKQAGLAYEKKTKKKSLDATEEHTRYINLISTLGPEVSQEKQDHMVSVSQRNAATTYSVAASLSRIADAEWLRTCECVRRFSPTIGPLGEWRALCEGGWTGGVPPDLPDDPHTPQRDVNTNQQQQQYDVTGGRDELYPPNTLTNANADAQESSSRGSTEYSGRPDRAPPPVYETPTSTPQREYPTPPSQQQDPAGQRQTVSIQDPLPSPQRANITERSSFERDRTSRPNHPPSAFEPPRPLVDPNTGSLRSLSAFPAPPTHFPLPPPRPKVQESSQGSERLRTESPLPVEEAEQGPSGGQGDERHTQVLQREKDRESPVQLRPSAPPSPEQLHTKPKQDPLPTKTEEESKPALDLSPPVARATLDTKTPSPASIMQTTPATAGHSVQHHKEGYFDNAGEFGIINGRPKPGEGKSQTLEKEHGRTSSIVAVMRTRYSNTSGSSSPPPKDIPRLPLSVPDLATRYQASGEPAPPVLPRAKSPPATRQTSIPPPPDSPTRSRYFREQERSPTVAADRSNEEVFRRQLDLKERERELLEREREIEMRSRELERDRARLTGYREESDRGGNNPIPTESQISPIRPRRRSLLQQLPRPLSHVDGGRQPTPTNVERPRSQYGYSSSNSNTSAGVSPRYAQDLQPPPSPGQYRSQQAERAYEDSFPQPGTRAYEPRKHLQNTQDPQPPPSPGQYRSQQVGREYDYDPYVESRAVEGQRKSQNTHPTNCNCETCALARYRSSGAGTGAGGIAQSISISTSTSSSQSPHPLTQELRPPEKPKGNWIRRLSMPTPFNLDSSKKQNPGKGVMFIMDGKKNVSTTNLKVQDDARRSYDVAGGNRSMTNLRDGARR